jgi:glycerol-3-phosphate dehydrogenase
MLIGTGHVPWAGDVDHTAPGEAALNSFIADINDAAPGLRLSRQEVLHVFSGLLPAAEVGSRELEKRPTVIDHGVSGGPAGLFSLVGIKYTTARDAARKALRASGLRDGTSVNYDSAPSDVAERNRRIELEESEFSNKDLALLHDLVATESVQEVSDLVYRRTSLGEDPETAQRASRLLEDFLLDRASTRQDAPD